MSGWRWPIVVVLGIALNGCAGATHRVPLVSDGEIATASSEIAAAPGLAPVHRSMAENRELVIRVASRLQKAAGPLCANAGYTPCIFRVDFDPSDEVNAYASGTDQIVINNGLVQYLETEDEVAAVVAHEMGHHIAGHIDKSVTNAGVGALASALLYTALLAAVAGGNLSYVDPQAYSDGLDGSMQIGAAVGNLSFSKEHEREADYIAAYMLARAGYDLDRARRLWVQLAKSSGNMQTDLFDTHPAGPDRLAAWDNAVIEVSASSDLLPNLK